MKIVLLFICLIIIVVVTEQTNTRIDSSWRLYNNNSLSGTSRSSSDTSVSRSSNIRSNTKYTKTKTWPISTSYKQSRTAISRYDTYKPLENYRARYGSSIKVGSDTPPNSHSKASTSLSSLRQNLNNHNDHNRLGIYGRTKKVNGSYTEEQQVSSSSSFHKPSKYNPVLPSSSQNPLPPSPSITSLLTHYSTLAERNDKTKRPIINPRRPFVRKEPRPIRGEGFGTAYLEWSEYGIGCTCDECGTRNCQHYSGVCECHDNIVGNNCDKCSRDHWGFASCQGCSQCQCSEASIETQCDQSTGQCPCQPGVTGQRCERCEPGYWNYSSLGCQVCTCRVGFSRGFGCDPVTGQCSCLPGVEGPNCDGCPYRWVLIEGVGCQQCDECVHALLNTTNELVMIISPVIEEFQSVAHSFFLNQRLGVIESNSNELRPLVDAFTSSRGGLLDLPINIALNSLYKDTNILFAQAGIISERASDSSVDGAQVRDEAEKVGKYLDETSHLTRAIVTEINKLVIGLETGTGAQIEQAIREAKDIIQIMEDVNYMDQKDKVELEGQLSKELFNEMKKFYYPINIQQSQIEEAAEHLKDLMMKVEEMRKYIFKSQDDTRQAQALSNNNRIYGLEAVKKKLKENEILTKAVMTGLQTSDDFITDAEDNLLNATNNLELLVTSVQVLREQKDHLNDTVIRVMTELQENYYPANKAKGHASMLKRTAEQLDSLLSDTREVAENALMAANAYKNIVGAIEEAYQAALAAKESGEKAVELSVGVFNNSAASLQKSEEKNNAAMTLVTQVEHELRPQLMQAKHDVDTLEDMNDSIKKSLYGIHSELDSLMNNNIEDRAVEQSRVAESAQQDARGILASVDTMNNKLEAKATTARQLLRDIADGLKALELADNQIGRVNQAVPQMVDMSKRLLGSRARIQEKGINVGERLNKLRQTIEKTRELAGKIKVGVDFDPATTIELQNPSNLRDDAATSTKVSLYMKTNDENGMLLFLGTPTGGSERMRRTSSDDFLALEVEGGYVRLTINLGEKEPYTFENSKVRVDDNVWHKVSVDRTGKVVQLAVHTEDENLNTEVIETVQKVLPGSYSVFNLDSKVSKIFVGGIPASVRVDDSIVTTHFYGQMEDLRVNDRPIGLWNFMSNGTDNIEVSDGAMGRDRLVNLEGPTGLSFNGNGYAAVESQGYRFDTQFYIRLKVKSFSKDGLIFLIHEGKNMYMSVEISEGYIVFRYNLGTGVAVITSNNNTYSEGEWVVIEATRDHNTGALKVDSEVFLATSPGSGQEFISNPTLMYFGGYPQEHDLAEVTNDDFNGCIDEVLITSRQIDLFKEAIESIGVVPGCKLEVASLVSFEKTMPGYVRLPSPENVNLQLVFKFRTDEPNGLLFYAGGETRTNFFTLSLVDGAFILRASPTGEINTGTYNKYNDSEWHVVIATRQNQKLKLDIDDYEQYEATIIQDSLPFDGPVFFGGVPDLYNMDAAASAVDTNFYGCIGDVTINGKVVNLAASRDRPGAVLQKCSLQKSTYSTYHLPSYGDGGIDQQPEVPIHVDYSEFPPSSTQSSTMAYTPIVPDDNVYYHSSTMAPMAPMTPMPPIEVSPDSMDLPEVDAIIPLSPPEYFPEFQFTDESVNVTEGLIFNTTMKPLDKCVLPLKPDVDSDITINSGLRFGNKKSSRIEYETVPASLRSDFKLSLEFRTVATEGIIFYASNEVHRDYFAIYIKDGQVVLSFNAGTGAAVVRSPSTYNDGEWHYLLIHREQIEGLLYIDGHLVANGSSSGEAKTIENMPPYYYGGISTESMSSAQINTENTVLSLNGCLRDFRMNNHLIGGKRNVFSVDRCSTKVEHGIFFGGGEKSQAILREKYNVGRVFEVTLKVKPRVNNGVIMSIHGRKDFVMLQLRDGSVEFSVDNGKGIIVATYTPSGQFSMCDGEWHSIRVLKNKNLVILVVDGVDIPPVSGKIGATSTDTKHPLFLGSQTRLAKRRGNPVAEKFVGCIKEVYLNSEPQDLANLQYFGDVNSGSCPII